MPRITKDDLNKLVQDPSGDNRAETADKISREFSTDTLSESERVLAEDIFRLMIRDAEIRVRKALAKNLAQTPLVPHDVAATLARDVDEVALPVLEFSEVLNDEDLVDIIGDNADSVEKQRAIASRAYVSEIVSATLVDIGHEDVMVDLMSNQGAEISEVSLQKVVNDFGDNERIQKPMIERNHLPITIAERLVTLVSERMRSQLISRGHIPEGIVNAVMTQSQESATIGLLGDGVEDRDVELLVEHLYTNNRLTSGLILRALCMGDVSFFEAALAKRAGVSLINTRILIHDSGPFGLEAIYNKAKLPEHFFPGVRAAIEVARETTFDGGEQDKERYSRRMIERVLTQYGDLGVEFDSDDVDYLMGRMLQLPSERAMHT
ncbi:MULTISPECIES: DUF2336 domain-containing protein [Thalassospira]|uniref:DUF2336 domain-containing protein n=1 Tax=Thalassospira povalilytica TaxID=732237 RepID=A0A8I1SJ60_9PROT|nr:MULTISPECIES: DUF2336 domain-containing protein [Thalassospira]MEE3046915.1 DUF2336 domain-containing protein [Pseudomonadota bacterium]RCK22793.1 hypothetical protein TH8_15815 [Thalassospira profundimaris]KZB59978.1 hypothetical protein AUQ42_07595 [Thalassospira sp. MCCC 1A02491]MBN8196240.1 DUF2336 domain-containing protein [Thalassospira povalilytica]MBO6772607.1 DUF2336 domain-containing protein [Thalassospira sp.]